MMFEKTYPSAVHRGWLFHQNVTLGLAKKAPCRTPTREKYGPNNIKKMEQKHRNILQTNFAYLIKNLHNVEDICDHLVSGDILTSGMMDSIKHKKPRPTGQTRELLSILPRRGMKAYKSFIHALHETGNGEVGDHLEKNSPKSNGQNSGEIDNGLSKPKVGNSDTQEAKLQHSEKPEETQKSESQNKQGWPMSEKSIQTIKKSDIKKCTIESHKKICESKQVYHMTGSKKGKFLSVSNVQCTTTDENTGAKTIDDSLTKKTECENKCRCCVDFDKTCISQLFTHMQYDSKAADNVREFQKKMVCLLLEMRTGVNELLGRQVDGTGAAAVPLPDVLTSKAETIEDFNNINDLLQNQQEQMRMIEHLKRIGGSTYKDNVQNILGRVMSNELMSKYNMKGNRGKLKFETTAMCKVIVESAKKMFPVTEHDILKVTAAYLNYAPDRIGGGGRKKAGAENDGAEVINGAEN
ncbi:Hypothetical predicted protein [Mytilus galloprovincialis]|uniref:CARD domain-containing protein n=1 Tax=Mytilus galloprovincialis TaxID=29158 RepID=A0A8B6DBY2_MYTGA|nr:Hypothetical predicted protein [Mytilus galloprovincialis]